MKLPSPFPLTVRAAVDGVKAFRKHLPRQRASLALSLSATMRFVLIVNTPLRKNRDLPRCPLPGKRTWALVLETA